MIKSAREGETEIQDQIIAFDAAKLNMLKRLIIRDRQSQMRWLEQK